MKPGVVSMFFALILSLPCHADMKAAERWVDSEFKPSTLSRSRQLIEMKWFVDAAERLKRQGIQSIRVVSEQIDTHRYEADVLAKAFAEITGIEVRHETLPEGDLIDRMQRALSGGGSDSDYDGWVNDSTVPGRSTVPCRTSR